MSKPKYTFTCVPTLDMSFDIHANSEQEASEILYQLTSEIVYECTSKLAMIGGGELGVGEYGYIQDVNEYEEDEE